LARQKKSRIEKDQKEADGCSFRSDSSIEVVSSESASVDEPRRWDVATGELVAVLPLSASSARPEDLNFATA
jgi:hypothetical protein